MKHPDHRFQVFPKLLLQGYRVRGSGTAEVGEAHPVLLGKSSLDLPKLLTVSPVGRTVRGVVVLEVTPALAGLEPYGCGSFAGTAGLCFIPRHRLHQKAGDRLPILPLLGSRRPPAVRGKPIRGAAVHRVTHRVVVYAEVVPIHQIDQVVQSQTPGGVGRLMGGTRSQSPLSLEHEHLYPLGAGALEGQGDAGGSRAAVARWAGVELEKQGSSLHLRVAG